MFVVNGLSIGLEIGSICMPRGGKQTAKKAKKEKLHFILKCIPGGGGKARVVTGRSFFCSVLNALQNEEYKSKRNHSNSMICQQVARLSTIQSQVVELCINTTLTNIPNLLAAWGHFFILGPIRS